MQVFTYDSVESTNETAKHLLRQPGFAGPAYVIAREQTAGKGTRGRKWSSPKDAGVYISVIETPANFPGREAACSFDNGSTRTEPPFMGEPVEPTAFTLAAGVACADCLQRLFGICVQLKPVNDLYVQGCKLGGILTEAVIERGLMTALITGIGINILRAPRPLEDAKATPVSLEELLGGSAPSSLDIQVIADAIAADVHALNMSVLKGEAGHIQWAWQRYQMTP